VRRSLDEITRQLVAGLELSQLITGDLQITARVNQCPTQSNDTSNS